MKQYFIISILALITWACSPSESTPKRPVDLGSDIFRKNCVLCHGVDGKLQFNGAKDLNLSTLTLEERVLLVTKGRKTMTAFKGILSEKEIRAVAKYSLKFSEKE